MHRRWLLGGANPEFVSHLAKASSISPTLARILINRGLKTVSEISDFIKTGPACFSDPFGLHGMRKAVTRIAAASERREKVLVHGDYDADGVTATAIMVHALRSAGVDVLFFVPHRITHGYGFHTSAVDEAARLGVTLIITVDCGVTSCDVASFAREKGIDVIITDHHEPTRKVNLQGSELLGPEVREFVLPDALAVINPKIGTADPGLMHLAGAGVAFKLAQAMAAEGIGDLKVDDALSLVDIAAIGTIADVVPLTGENRTIVREGLGLIRNSRRPAINALKEVCGLKGREIKAGLLAFTVVPRINAAGRISDPRDAVRFFLSEDEEEARGLSMRLDSLNQERQRIEEDVYQEALVKAGDASGYALVLSGEGWHLGVLGIVASRLTEKFNRPAFVLSVGDGIAKGSARSIPSFDLCGGLATCRELLLSFGGHKQAAGLRLTASNIPRFRKAMSDLVREKVTDEGFIPTLEIDAVLSLHEVTHALVKELELLEPFGCGNREPLFGSKGLKVVGPRIVGNNHLKMKLKKKAHSLDTIGFDMGSVFEDLKFPSEVDAVFTPTINEWNGGKYLQLILRGLRPGSE